VSLASSSELDSGSGAWDRTRSALSRLKTASTKSPACPCTRLRQNRRSSSAWVPAVCDRFICSTATSERTPWSGTFCDRFLGNSTNRGRITGSAIYEPRSASAGTNNQLSGLGQDAIANRRATAQPRMPTGLGEQRLGLQRQPTLKPNLAMAGLPLPGPGLSACMVYGADGGLSDSVVWAGWAPKGNWSYGAALALDRKSLFAEQNGRIEV
jgi:hypothetical protein